MLLYEKHFYRTNDVSLSLAKFFVNPLLNYQNYEAQTSVSLDCKYFPRTRNTKLSLSSIPEDDESKFYPRQ